MQGFSEYKNCEAKLSVAKISFFLQQMSPRNWWCTFGQVSILSKWIQWVRVVWARSERSLWLQQNRAVHSLHSTNNKWQWWTHFLASFTSPRLLYYIYEGNNVLLTCLLTIFLSIEQVISQCMASSDDHHLVIVVLCLFVIPIGFTAKQGLPNCSWQVRTWLNLPTRYFSRIGTVASDVAKHRLLGTSS